MSEHSQMPAGGAATLPSSVIVTIALSRVGYLPILIDRGEVVVDVLRWLIYEKVSRQMSPSTLAGYARALSRFLDFWTVHTQEPQEVPLVKTYFDALVHGNKDLGWKSVSILTARRYVEDLSRFLDWFTDRYGVEHPNPHVEETVTWAALVAERARRYKSDLLYHLFSTTKRASKRTVRKYLPVMRAQRAITPRTSRPEKKFSFSDFVTLVAFEEDLRNKLLWLLLGGGGLRNSEVVHLFVSDITCDLQSSEARVLLADPSVGPLRNSPLGRMTRQEFLRTQFHLVPRNQLSTRDLRYAGWKGMRYLDGTTAGVTWLHPELGQEAWATHELYLAERSKVPAKHHPWYLVNFKHNVGEPLTLRNVGQLLEASCKRLGLISPPNPHALRHMYVDVIVNELKMSTHDAQILVRHRSPASTEIYAAASEELVRRSLQALSERLELSGLRKGQR